MAKFREVERGWSTFAVQVNVEKTAIDNIENNWEALLLGTELESSDDNQLVTEQNLDFYIERFICHYKLTARPTALNTAEYVECAVGLCILDRATALKDDVPLALTSNAFWQDTARETPEYIRMLRLNFHRAFPGFVPLGTGGGETTVPEWSPPDIFNMFDVKNIFLRRNEALCVILGQTGNSDNFLTWSTGDEVDCGVVTQALIRKKKGR